MEIGTEKDILLEENNQSSEEDCIPKPNVIVKKENILFKMDFILEENYESKHSKCDTLNQEEKLL